MGPLNNGRILQLVVAASVLAGCAVDLPGAGAANEGMESLVENRVWVERDTGEVLIFVRDGPLVAGRCGGAMALGTWRWSNEAVLSWKVPEGRGGGEVGLAGPRELALMTDPDNPAGEVRRFRAAKSPRDCR